VLFKLMKNVVLLDPGHGGSDPGAVAYGLMEKDLNLKLAHRVEATLEAMAGEPLWAAEKDEDIRVLFTRKHDVYVSLQERVEMSARAEADFFVSLHANAGGGHGFESFVYEGLGGGDPAVRMQGVLHRNIMEELARWNIRDRGRKSASFYVLRYNSAPAVLVESLFVDNKQEAGLWREESFVEALAVGVAAGIREALGLAAGGGGVSGDEGGGAGSGGSGAGAGDKILYTVQVGAFASIDNARRCLERARSRGFGDAFIYLKDHGLNGALNTVQVGAFASVDNARRCLDKARSSGFSDAFIYPKEIS